jgi:hypothetical protein
MWSKQYDENKRNWALTITYDFTYRLSYLCEQDLTQ